MLFQATIMLLGGWNQSFTIKLYGVSTYRLMFQLKVGTNVEKQHGGKKNERKILECLFGYGNYACQFS